MVDWNDLYAHAALVYDMGASQTGRVITALSVLTFVGVWKPTLEYYGIPITLALVFGLAGYIIGNFITGAYFYYSGMYKKVLDLGNENNVQWQEMKKDVKSIKTALGIVDGGP